MSFRRLDLSHSAHDLMPVFSLYPPGNYCDLRAQKVRNILQAAGYEAEIVTIQNEQMPGQPWARPPYIQARRPDGQPFLLAEIGFHQASRIRQDDTLYYVDALVHQHFGFAAVVESDYFELFVYPDGVEITGVPG